ncbi:MAG: hypothetical protein QF475_01085 [Candidatus Undinarchaeales archaeon]|jgi:outer membrane biosynthesis protein TonB|nr:hypothetical protein [Candidatus Undinarchaeales archaeon]
MNLKFFGKKEHPEDNKKGYDILKASCNSCNHAVMELMIAVDTNDRDDVKKAEEKIEDLVIRHIHKKCPFCGEKLKEPKIEESFKEVEIQEAKKEESTPEPVAEPEPTPEPIEKPEPETPAEPASA